MMALARIGWLNESEEDYDMSFWYTPVQMLALLWVSNLILATVLGSPAEASLVGDTVEFDRFYNGSSTGQFQSEVVGGAAEFRDYKTSSQFLSVNVGGSTIDFDWVAPVSYGIGNPSQYYLVSDLDWVGSPGSTITGVNVDFGSLSWFTSDRVTFGDDFVRVDIGGLVASSSSFINIVLTASHSVVPEPATLFVWSGLGLAAACSFYASAKKKRAHSQA
jgi:hypothetical protein